jgi:D-ribose pyranase
MLKRKLLNAEILKTLAYMGVGDQIIVVSSKFPAIDGVEVIDISLMRGFPTIEQVVDVLLDEVDFDMATVSEEVKIDNDEFVQFLAEPSKGLRADLQTYRQLKIVAKNVVKVIRTGDDNLYKSVILRVAE